MGHINWHGHQCGRFVTSESEHHTLVACTDVFNVGILHLTTFIFHGVINAQGDICALTGDRREDPACFAIKPLVAAVIANF